MAGKKTKKTEEKEKSDSASDSNTASSSNNTNNINLIDMNITDKTKEINCKNEPEKEQRSEKGSIEKTNINLNKNKKNKAKTNTKKGKKAAKNTLDNKSSYKEKYNDNSEDNDSDDDSDNDTKGTVIILVAISVIIIIAIGIFMIPKWFGKNNENEKYTYNYFKFEKISGTWFTESQEGNNLYQIALRYGPKELENISVQGSIYSFRQFDEVYITFDPTEKEFGDVTMANAEVATKLAQHFGVTLFPACTKNTTDCITAEAEIVTCESNMENYTGRAVIFLNQEPGPKVIIDGNCAIIQGEGRDVIKAADRFMLGYYGIIK